VVLLKEFACCLCGGKESTLAFSALDFDESVESFDLLQCTLCGLAQTWPLPESKSIDKHYSKIYYGSGAKKFSGIVEYLTVLGNRSRAKKIKRVLDKTKLFDGSIKVLDIGCGRANLLRSLSTMNCECFGIERKDYPSEINLPNIEFHLGSLEDRKFDDSFFDAVIIWHVLEHLHQPHSILDEVTRITSERGIAAIAVPNFSSLQSRWFKANWFHLDLPRHLFHFDVDNLSRALTERGFVIHSVSTCSLEQNLFGFIQSLMNSFRFLGKPNDFYQLLKDHSGITRKMKLVAWLFAATLIFPFALIELIVSCLLKKGASVVIFAYKA
jgi:ubiquinone/menaquinone biosynthesis C-methylase UbiE